MVADQLHEAIETLSMLRLRVLHDDPENADLRSSFRTISYHLESIRQQRPVSYNEFRQLANWLAMFLDADFGIRLRQYDQLSDADMRALVDHINARKKLVQHAEGGVSVLHEVLESCLATLNVTHPEGLDPENQARLLGTELKKHVQDDEKLRMSLQSLIKAMQESLESISATLSDMGGEIPELAETQALLAGELPGDPKQAQDLLNKARENILRAGKKVGEAGKAISEALESQKTQMKQMNESLNRAEFEAQHDPLTGLANRRKLAERFKTLGDTSATFLIIDVDHFKQVNDSFGHDAGDEVLVAMAGILSNHVRTSDLVVRLGGEEFAALLPEVDSETGYAIAESLRGAIQAGKIKTAAGKIDVTVSVGLATRKPGEAIGHWIGRGDKALYEAKHKGRNRTEVSTD